MKVLIIDNSPTICEQLKNFLETNLKTEVLTTTTLIKANTMIYTEAIDVILLDINLQTEKQHLIKDILAIRKVAIIVMAENTIKHTGKIVQAMHEGATDYFKKTYIDQEQLSNSFKKQVMRSLQTMQFPNTDRNKPLFKKINRIKVDQNMLIAEQPVSANPKKHTVVVVGTSTGGPSALQTIITQLPRDFPAPVLIVQHMPAAFTKSLANRLNQLAQIHVKEAEQDEIVQKGTVYIAPGNRHMCVRQVGATLKMHLTEDQPRGGHRPAVDTLFESIAKTRQINIIAMILTGMGRDGAIGVKQIKRLHPNAIIIAESKQTAAIYGMPNAAIATNLVTYVLPIDAMASTLIECVQ